MFYLTFQQRTDIIVFQDATSDVAIQETITKQDTRILGFNFTYFLCLRAEKP